jgi:hypothetical protein
MNSKLLTNIASTLIAVGLMPPTLSAPEPLVLPREVVAVAAKRASFSIELETSAASQSSTPATSRTATRRSGVSVAKRPRS